MLFRETVAVYCENRTEHTNTLCGFLILKQVVHTVTMAYENESNVGCAVCNSFVRLCCVHADMTRHPPRVALIRTALLDVISCALGSHK
jgi:hypothetical protein